MVDLGVGRKEKERILARWDVDKQEAISEVRSIGRKMEIERAQKAFTEAKNYFLLNSLYLDDATSKSIEEFFSPLNNILLNAKFPEAKGTTDIVQDKKLTVERLEKVRKLFREERRVVERSTSTA